MATITAAAAGGNWNATGTWDTGTVPTAADNVILGPGSGSVTINANAVARSLTCTGYAGTLAHNAGVSLSLGDATPGTGNAALTLAAGMTYTLGNGSTSAINLVSTSATQQTVTTAGKTCGNVSCNGTGGSWTLADPLTCAALTVFGGTLNTGNQTVTCTNLLAQGATATAVLGTSTINLTSTTSGINILVRLSSATITAGAATINIASATANTRNFLPISTALSQATLNYTVAGSTGTLAFSGALDLGALNAGAGRTLQFASGGTYTIRSGTLLGSSGSLLTIQSSTNGSAATVSKPYGIMSADHLSVKDITAAGGASWYAGANSTAVSGVTGWVFTPPANNQMFHM